MAKRRVIGIDFGTLSARAVLADSRDGRVLASAVCDYPEGVIEDRLPGQKARLKAKSALQNPTDYLTALEAVARGVMKKGKARPEEIGGIGIDFTSCTVLPVRSDGTPLCCDHRFAKSPHAWAKLWKHHATQPEADAINALGAERGERFMEAYGGKHSSEWFFAKVLETAREAPEIYAAADFFSEAGDWLVWQLTGRQTRNVSAAGFKGMRVHRENGAWGYPSKDYFRALHPKLENVIAEKLGGPVLQLGTKAGELSEAMARRLKLEAGIPVAAANIDAHAGVPACGVTRPGTLVMIMGTSTCHLLIAERGEAVEGICGVVEDGVAPGYWGYEAGQAGVGDLFAWFADHAAPEYAAGGKKKSAHEALTDEAAKLRPGESGLLALDWWNGNRSVLADADLSGLLVGLTLQSRPHEIYRALIEATAFGTRQIVEAFEKKGISIGRIVASGGLAQKNSFLVQVYADVLQRPIDVAGAEQSSALGAAMWGAVAGGLHRDIHEAVRRMAPPPRRTHRPDRAHGKIYGALYEEYARLHDLFGRDARSPMKKLREIQHGGRSA